MISLIIRFMLVILLSFCVTHQGTDHLNHQFSYKSFPSVHQGSFFYQNNIEEEAPTESPPSQTVTPLLTKNTFSLPIALYHSVSEEKTSSNAYIISVEELRADLQYLKDNGYTTVFMSEVINFVLYNGDLPEKPVILSFDDGYEDNYHLLLPLLEEYDMKAVISLISSTLDHPQGDNASQGELSQGSLTFLTPEQAQIMAASGHVEFQCHTYDMHFSNNRHGSLPLDFENIQDYLSLLQNDILQSRQTFQLYQLQPSTTFAYPGGLVSWENKFLVETHYTASFVTYPITSNQVTRGDASCLYNLTRLNRDQGVSVESYFNKLLYYAQNTLYF